MEDSFFYNWYCWGCHSRLFHLFSSGARGSGFTQGATLPFGALRTILTTHPWSTGVSLTDTDGVTAYFSVYVHEFVCFISVFVLCVITVSPLAPISPFAPGKPSSPWTQHTYITIHQHVMKGMSSLHVFTSHASETSEKHLITSRREHGGDVMMSQNVWKCDMWRCAEVWGHYIWTWGFFELWWCWCYASRCLEM